MKYLSTYWVKRVEQWPGGMVSLGCEVGEWLGGSEEVVERHGASVKE